MGHRWELEGRGTVRIGSKVFEEIGGSTLFSFSDDDEEGRFASLSESSGCFFEGACCVGGRLGRTGGGNSIFSAALRDS